MIALGAVLALGALVVWLGLSARYERWSTQTPALGDDAIRVRSGPYDWAVRGDL